MHNIKFKNLKFKSMHIDNYPNSYSNKITIKLYINNNYNKSFNNYKYLKNCKLETILLVQCLINKYLVTNNLSFKQTTKNYYNMIQKKIY